MISKNSLFILIVCLISCRMALAATDLCAATAYADICVKISEKSYLIDGNAMLNWYEAERLCRRQNGYLVTLQNINQLHAISTHLVTKGYLNGDQKFWTGGSDLGAKGTFYSVLTGNLLPFGKWLAAQPKTESGENCVALAKQNNEFLMTVSDCNKKLRYVCQLQEIPDVSKKLLITYKYV